MDLRKIKLPGRRRITSVLGLTLDGSRLEGVVVHRTNGSVQVTQSFVASLSLDPLTDAPELVGREIRNQLDAAGARERTCVVGLPLKWALTVPAQVPELAEADVASFLQIEAERGFPSDVSTLMVANSRWTAPNGVRHATLIGIPRNHIARLELVLRAAQLRPISLSLGIQALQPSGPADSPSTLALLIGDGQVGLQASTGGGVAALRAIEQAAAAAGGDGHAPYADVVAREVRITLGQMPADVRDTIRRVRVFGPSDLAHGLAREASVRFESMGLAMEVVTGYAAGEFGFTVPAGVAISPAFCLAARYLAAGKSTLEFLPPKVTAWQQVAARLSSGKLQRVGAAVGAVGAVVLALFLFQQFQLIRLNARWAKIRSEVSELKELRQRQNQFAPWFDTTHRSVSILRQLTEAFPEDGSVTAKTIEVRDLANVTCSGTAQDSAALQRTLGKLLAVRTIQGLKVDQIRGKSPLQFTFNFHWNDGGKNAD